MRLGDFEGLSGKLSVASRNLNGHIKPGAGDGGEGNT